MRSADYLWLFILGIAVAGSAAIFQSAPGYMDADYYCAVGQRLAEGRGFSEPFLWNYLDDPAGLPHPSHAYWMPLASMLAAVGMKIKGVNDFSAARMGFSLLSGFIPPLTAALANSLYPKRGAALLGGALSVVAGFYLPFLTTTDTFAITMVLGAAFFLAMAVGRTETQRKPSRLPEPLLPLLFGVLAGLMHLSRPDGVIWLIVALLAAFSRKTVRWAFVYVLLGYLAVMTPWLARNLTAFGALFAPGGTRALWLTRYDELFVYPASLLTPARWWASGLAEILRVRLWALGQNLQTAFAVQGEIFLWPLVLAGAWHFKRDFRIRLGIFVWLAIFGLMTLIFPFAGARGGLFHSSAGLQPLFWALTPAGLDVFVGWGVRRRGWHADQARQVFSVGLVSLAALLTLIVSAQRLVGPDLGRPHWGQGEALYARLDGELQRIGAGLDEIVLVNNSPGYSLASGRPAIAIPDGDLETLLAVAQRYHARYVLLEYNHPRQLDDLYDHPGDRPGLDFLTSFEGVFIFRIGE